jgi:hypothetical protein
VAEERAPTGVLAGRVADGESVDWDAALRGTPEESERRVIRQLRVVASLAEVHRSGTAAPASAAALEATSRMPALGT